MTATRVLSSFAHHCENLALDLCREFSDTVQTSRFHLRQERSEAFRSDGMDQQEADDKHHRAGYAMNGERSRPRPARSQND